MRPEMFKYRYWSRRHRHVEHLAGLIGSGNGTSSLTYTVPSPLERGPGRFAFSPADNSMAPRLEQSN